MECQCNRSFGGIISRLLDRQNLRKPEAHRAFSMILGDTINEMQQGAFLAALKAKGETAEEIAGVWEAIYELDTVKAEQDEGLGLVDTCGTGMDSCRTFNISTAASLVAAAGGVKIARHGARAISSSCGTVDIAQSLGVDVECPVELVMESIRRCGIGLYNGMSPAVHPGALGRILSQIHFGSPLNIAASLANPALPKKAVRGVYAAEMMEPVLDVMQQIGYTDVIIVHGRVDGSQKSMDEASVCGPTLCLRLHRGRVREEVIRPEEVGLRLHCLETIKAKENRDASVRHLLALLAGRGDEGSRDISALNAGLVFLVDGQVETLAAGVELAQQLLASGRALDTLRSWVICQNRNPENGKVRLQSSLDKVTQ